MSDNPYIIAGNALEDTSCGDYDVSSAIVDALYDAGLLYMGPRIIRTVEELDALDDDAFLMASDGNIYYAIGAKGRLLPSDIPAVVIREGAEVRAAQETLEKETDS